MKEQKEQSIKDNNSSNQANLKLIFLLNNIKKNIYINKKINSRKSFN